MVFAPKSRFNFLKNRRKKKYMAAAWFVDGAYLYKLWSSLGRQDSLDFLKLRQLLERQYCDAARNERIEDAYYFNADGEPSMARQSAFHMALQYPPPTGPGLRVKLYWLQRRQIWWPASMGGLQVVHPSTGQPYEVVQQKAVDVGLATNLVRSHAKRGWQKLFLAAGDGDFHEPIQHLVEHENVDLVLIGSPKTISTELQPYAQSILRIDAWADQIARPRPTRSAVASDFGAK
jgi:uncharacterized LabA/DUF88 family protein